MNVSALILRANECTFLGPITNTKNYKGLFMFAEELAALGDAEQIYNPAAQISASSSWEQAMHRCLSRNY